MVKCLSTLGLTLLLSLAGCTTTEPPQRSETQEDGQRDEASQGLSEPQDALYQEALQQARQGDYRAARQRLLRLSEQQPGHAPVWLHLATAYYHTEQTERARQALDNALELDPTLARAHNLAGTLALAEGDPEAAEASFRQALEHNPQLARAHYNLALLHDTYYQDLARAIEHYRAYLERTPEDDERTVQWVEQLENSLARQED